jgi:hypothetical protein
MTAAIDGGIMATKKTETVDTPQANDVAGAISMMAQILTELKSRERETDPRLETLAKGVEALVQREKSRPHENPNSPEISFMNPLGERDHPRPELKCKMFWVGFRLTKDGLTREEIDLLNTIKAGIYRVTKADGKQIPFTVAATQDAGGKLEKMTFHFPCKSVEDRNNHLAMSSYLREALGDIAPSVDLLMQQVRRLQAELDARNTPRE